MASSWIEPFKFFCSKLTIDSKETGVGPLKFFGSQNKYLEEIDEGFSRGVQHFIILKSRQLGISTISIALDLFWVLINPGTQGAIITHDEASREDFRNKIKRYMASLPPELRLAVPTDNRYRLDFSNGSVLHLMVAGTRAKGTLGRAFGLNFLHGTECSSWGDEEGLIALRNSLAEYNPKRLYIFESTARGFNLWNKIWHQVEEDPSMKRFFLGWYLREDQRIERSDTRFDYFWDGVPTLEEQERSDLVFDRYGIIIQPEQLAWYRWKMKNTGDELLGQQEQPWTEEEAFIMSGQPFFPLRQLTRVYKQELSTKFKAYRYILGDDFLATQLEPVGHSRFAELRVWEEPDPEGVYIVGADPAFGASELSDRSCAEVYRCYADRLVQVAEFASPLVSTAQFAWVISHLAGAYRNTMVNLEINGPGAAVWQEILHLKQQFNSGVLASRAKDYTMGDVFGGIRYYFYHRLDSTGSGLAYHWKTNSENKRRILNQLKDSFSLNMLELHSVPLLDEMREVTIAEGSIGAEGGGKDDRVIASALAHVGWTDWVRRRMISEGRTYEVEMDRIKKKIEGAPHLTMSQSIVQDFFQRRQADRLESQSGESKWR